MNKDPIRLHMLGSVPSERSGAHSEREAKAAQASSTDARAPGLGETGLGVFAKGLPHDRSGRVKPQAYARYQQAVAEGETDASGLQDTRAPLTRTAASVWPKRGGPDLPGPWDRGDESAEWSPSPVGARDVATDLAELYALSLVRDLPLEQFEEPTQFLTDVHRMVTAVPGAWTMSRPPGMSLWPVPKDGVLSRLLPARIQRRPSAQQDYMTDWIEWLDVQNGADTRSGQHMRAEPTPLRTLRDLAGLTRDRSPGAVFAEAVAEIAPQLPAVDEPSLFEELRQVSRCAAQAALRHKLHQRRARPEALAAWLTLRGNGHGFEDLPLDQRLDRVLDQLHLARLPNGLRLLDLVEQRNATGGRVFQRHRRVTAPRIDHSYLLPMAWPEGAPLCPGDPSAQAALAGACATVLKARLPVFATPERWDPRPLPQTELSLVAEIDKLAANICLGRMAAGVSFALDVLDGMCLGESAALAHLCESMAGHQAGETLRICGLGGDRIWITAEAGGRATVRRQPA